MNEEIKIDFPLPLERPKIDDAPRSYNLTINALLEKNDGISQALGLQEEILKDIPAKSLIGSGIYKYPPSTIHFSIINLEDLHSGLVTQEVFERERRSYIDRIKQIFTKFDGITIKDKNVKFSYIYTKESPSIAIQAFPSNDLYNFLAKELLVEFTKEKELGAEIKGYPFKNNHYDVFRFSTNIIRFFRKLSKEEYEIISKRVLEINNRSSKGGCLFSINLTHLSFVLSDNWLSNGNPELSYIKLK